ncbi:MAG: hypothetical protein ACT4PN_18305 [Nitrospiraceae bacterium]
MSRSPGSQIEALSEQWSDLPTNPRGAAMTAIIFKTKLTWLKLDAAEFADWTGLPEPDVQAMRDGTRAIPKIVERLVDVLCRNARLEAMRVKRARR